MGPPRGQASPAKRAEQKEKRQLRKDPLLISRHQVGLRCFLPTPRTAH